MHPYQICQITLAFIAILLNSFTLLALYHVRNRLGFSHRLLISLALADVTLSLTVIMTVCTQILAVSDSHGNSTESTGSAVRLASGCVSVTIKALHSFGQVANLLTLAAMAYHHYQRVTNSFVKLQNSKNRNRIILVSIWIAAALSGFSSMIVEPMVRHSKGNSRLPYCQRVWYSSYQEEYLTMSIAVLACLFMAITYTSMFRRIKHVYALRAQERQSIPRRDLTRQRRAIQTTLMILTAFLLCWMPMNLFQISLIIVVKWNPSLLANKIDTLLKVDISLHVLFLANTVADPIIYAIRTTDVQVGYKRTLGMCCNSIMENSETGSASPRERRPIQRQVNSFQR